MIKFDAYDARAIVDAHEIDRLVDNEEEWQLLEDNNPELAEAYTRLLALARKAVND